MGIIKKHILEVIQNDMAVVRNGFVNFDANYADAVAKLKAAGIDEYIAEVQRQYDEFLVSKG